jgi:lipopolysaccharide/colanic/teichoic acid biosynthesis glycosyltransferase
VNRALDVAIAGTGLVVTAPVLAMAALAVKLEDGGPVL